MQMRILGLIFLVYHHYLEETKGRMGMEVQWMLFMTRWVTVVVVADGQLEWGKKGEGNDEEWRVPEGVM